MSLVDFSPMVKPRLFALACAVYWTRVHGRSELDVEAIASDVLVYNTTRPLTPAEEEVFPAMLMAEALRRLATPLVLAAETGRPPDPHRVAARYRAVELLGNSG